MLWQVVQQLNAAIKRVAEVAASPFKHKEELALVIDGKALHVALQKEHKPKLLRLGMACKVSLTHSASGRTQDWTSTLNPRPQTLDLQKHAAGWWHWLQNIHSSWLQDSAAG